MRKVALIVSLAMMWMLVVAAAAAAQERKTATFWYSFGGNNRVVTEELIRQFNASQSEYYIEGSFQGDYFEALAKVRAAIVTNTAPTIFQAIPEILPSLWESGILESLEPFFHGPNGVDESEFIFGLSQDGYFDYLGKDVPIFSIPFNRSTPLIYYNKDMFSAKGVTPPNNWDEWREVATALTEYDGNTQLVWGHENPIDWWFWLGGLYQSGGTLLNADGTRASFAQGGTEALDFWVSMVNDCGCMKRPPGRDYNAWEVTNIDFINERVAMIETSTAYLAYLEENAPFEIGAAFLPANKQRATPTGGTFIIMTAGTPKDSQEAAWAFMKWMTDTEQTIYWSLNTGYMPVRESAIHELQDFYLANPNYKVAYDQLIHAVKLPFSNVLYDIQREVIQPNLEAPVLGRGTAEQMMRRAEQDTNWLIEDNM